MGLDTHSARMIRKFELRNTDDIYKIGDLKFNKKSIDNLIKINDQREYVGTPKPHIQDIIQLAKAIGRGEFLSVDEFTIKLVDYIKKYQNTPGLDITIEKLCADECLGIKDVEYLQDQVSFAQTHRPIENNRSEQSIPAKESDHGGATSEDYFDYRITPESKTNFYSVGSLQFPKANIDALIENIGKAIAQEREISADKASIKVKDYQRDIWNIANDIKEGKYGKNDGMLVDALQTVIQSAEQENQKGVTLERLCAEDCFNLDVEQVKKLKPSNISGDVMQGSNPDLLSLSGTTTASFSPEWKASVSTESTGFTNPTHKKPFVGPSSESQPVSEIELAKEEDVRDLDTNADSLLSLLRSNEENRYHSIVTDLTHIKGKLERGHDFTKKEVDDYNKKIHKFLIDLLNTKSKANFSPESTVISVPYAIDILNSLDRKRSNSSFFTEGGEIGATPLIRASEKAIETAQRQAEESREQIISAVPRLEAVARKTAEEASNALNGMPFGRHLTAEEASKESWGVGWTGIPPETASDIIDQNKNKRMGGFFAGARNLAKKTVEAVKQHKGKTIALALAVLTSIGGAYWLKNRGDHQISGPQLEQPVGKYDPNNPNLMYDTDKPNRHAEEDRKYETPIVTEQMIKECREGKYTYMIKCIREVIDGQEDSVKKQLVDIIHTAAKERAQREGKNFDTLAGKEKHAYVDAVIGGSGIKLPEGKDPKRWFKGLKDKTPASYIADKLGLFSTTHSFASDVNRNIKNLGVHIKMPGVGGKITPELVIEAIKATLKK